MLADSWLWDRHQEKVHTGPEVQRNPLWLYLDNIKLSLARALGAQWYARVNSCCAARAFDEPHITATFLQVLAQVAT